MFFVLVPVLFVIKFYVLKGGGHAKIFISLLNCNEDVKRWVKKKKKY